MEFCLKMNNFSEEYLKELLDNLFKYGPKDKDTLENLSIFKYLKPDLFAKYEQDIILAMGLFFKKEIKNESLVGLTFNILREAIKTESCYYTPVQADIINKINSFNTFAFSAPTSIGKSFLLRDILLKENGNVVILVPSRALINEYIEDIRATLVNNKIRNCNVLQFVNLINTKHTNRNIFVLTPERCFDLFKNDIQISLFIFDEAHLADSSNGLRAIKFKTVISKINSNFKEAKKLFSFPFVTNLNDVCASALFRNANNIYYPYQNVGQIFIEKHNEKFVCFSSKGENLLNLENDPILDTLNKGKRVLVYCTKAKICDGTIYNELAQYIDICKINETKDHNISEAKRIIKEVQHKIGASARKSQLVANLKRGVAIHHGSLPHEVRKLIENFVRCGFAQLCISTSTLEQGVNLPFDLIYIYENHHLKNPIDMRNLIGRAGRSTEINKFDYGIIVTRNKNYLTERLNANILVDIKTDPKVEEDFEMEKTALENDSIDNETNLPKERLKLLSEAEILDAYSCLLDELFENNRIKDKFEKDSIRKIIDLITTIYKNQIKNREMNNSEIHTLKNTVYVLISKLQKKKFSQIVAERNSYIKTNYIIKKKDYLSCCRLPNKHAPFEYLFNNVKDKFRFDLIVYDTFEIIDQNISLYLSDILNGLSIVFEEKRPGNPNNLKFINLIKYGSDEEKEILLFKYGFYEDEIVKVIECIEAIDETEIKFNKKIKNLSDDLKRKCDFFIYN